MVFAVSFLCYFYVTSVLVVKKKKKLLHGTSICMSSKSVFQIFKILFQTGDINFLTFVVSVLVDMFD